MRLLFLSALVFVLFASSAHAALNDWNIDISVNDDGSNDWIVTLTYNETVTSSDYFVLTKLYNVEVLADNEPISCDVKEDIGMSIVCKNIAATQIKYKFHTKKFVENIQNLKMFKYGFSVVQVVDKLHVKVSLPLGTALVDDLKLGNTGLKPFEPDFGRQGTDGRRISVSWTYDKPTLGQPVNVYTIYEIVGFDPFVMFVIIIIVIIAAFIMALIMLSRKQKMRDILPVLTEGERRIMEILLRERGEVDQRILVKETDFSKAKVSRIINDLIARGILDKISRGRKNLIKLKKEIKQPERKADKQKEEKS